MQFSRRHFLGTAALAGAGAGLAVEPAAASPGAAGLFNLADFGVLPDSADDQSAAVQEAIDKASRSGGVLVVPPGTYRVRGLRLKKPLTMEGHPGLSVLSFAGDGGFVSIEAARNVNLRGLTFDGRFTALTDALLTARSCRDLVIEDCAFTHSIATGLSLAGCSGRIAGCTVERVAKAGIFSLDARGLQITGNTVRDADNNGILVWRSEKGEDSTLVANNRIERIGAKDGGSGQNGNGINIFRAGNVIAANNRITDCAFSAIRSNAGSACQMIGNSCARLGEVALYAEFGFEGAVIANNVVEKAASGITVTNFNEGGRLAVCSGNIVRDLFVRPGEVDGRGVGISAEADTVIEGNVVENAPVQGIALGWTHHLRDCTATGNVLRNCGIGIAVSASPGAGHALVASNMISGAKKAAIAGLDRDELVTTDLGHDAAAAPANVSIQGNLVG